MRFVNRSYVVATLLPLIGMATTAVAEPPQFDARIAQDNQMADPLAGPRFQFDANSQDSQIVDEPPIREYAWGVQRLPMDGGKIYGWKLNDKVTFGRFKGENDEFGFSVRLNARQRVEFTADGLRWRRAVGGGGP